MYNSLRGPRSFGASLPRRFHVHHGQCTECGEVFSLASVDAIARPAMCVECQYALCTQVAVLQEGANVITIRPGAQVVQAWATVKNGPVPAAVELRAELHRPGEACAKAVAVRLGTNEKRKVSVVFDGALLAREKITCRVLVVKRLGAAG